MLTDRSVAHNKPYILILNMREKRADIVEVGMKPLDENLGRTIAEKVLISNEKKKKKKI
ncbi:hypothetical protein O3M35_005874 [Rhynocoris fuscipes]|uniref:Uncharacterized protein n=1 Tax=Rhynocoris fuscipes TaxID=488301 RepID=A0AAW1DJS4_9HEMI